jgi:hypothetical protein
MPVRLIKEYLYTVHSLTLSAGEIVGLLHRVAEAEPLKRAAYSTKERVRRSRVVHADETTWREEGQNGYVWSFSTPEGERYYEYNRSRAGEIPKGILGSSFKGVLCSDFYCGYNGYEGEHQRCWTHLLRDLHSLKEEHPDNEQVQEWAKGVRALYDEANKLLLPHELGPPTYEEAAQHSVSVKHRERQEAYRRLVEQTANLGRKYAEAKAHRTHPCHALCKRLLRHQEELFQFVLVPGLSSSNNMAERSVRPVVVSRKVSGGTQSPRGSRTRMTLASLLGTWRAKGLNPFDQCLALLSQTPDLALAPQV